MDNGLLCRRQDATGTLNWQVCLVFWLNGVEESSRFAIRDERTVFRQNADIANDNLCAAFECLPGVMFAGAVYPFLLGFFWVGIGLVFLGLPNAAPVELIEAAGIGIVYLCIAGTLGVLIAILSGLLSAVLLSLFSWTMGNLFSPRLIVALTGGLAGFLPTSFVLPATSFAGLIPLVSVWLAVLTGQVGARWFYSQQEGSRKTRRTGANPNFQFRIRHMMAATVWVSVVLAISQIFSNFVLYPMIPVPGFELFLLMLTWVLMQASCIGLERAYLAIQKSRRAMGESEKGVSKTRIE